MADRKMGTTRDDCLPFFCPQFFCQISFGHSWTKTSDGTPWGTGWRNLKLVRKPADGTIEVCFDAMQTPVTTATDKTFTWGQVGLGSFDDTGNFANFKLSGNRAKMK
jgi:hypothetical protein